LHNLSGLSNGSVDGNSRLNKLRSRGLLNELRSRGLLNELRSGGASSNN